MAENRFLLQKDTGSKLARLLLVKDRISAAGLAQGYRRGGSAIRPTA
jgi:hypothetical protein